MTGISGSKSLAFASAAKDSPSSSKVGKGTKMPANAASHVASDKATLSHHTVTTHGGIRPLVAFGGAGYMAQPGHGLINGIQDMLKAIKTSR